MLNKIYAYIKENLWFFISLIIILFLFNFELPYYVETPGGFISLNDRIKVDDNYKFEGDYGLAYVSMLKGTLPFLGISYLNKDWDIVEKNKVMYEDENLNTMNERERYYLNEALANAKIVAYRYANKDVNIKDTKFFITYLNNDNTELKLLDCIKEVNGISINSLEDIRNIINNTNQSSISLKVIRNNKEIDVNSSLIDKDGVKFLGIIVTPNYELDINPNIDINMKNNESGSSGGLMLALGIYSKITNNDLTKGDKIIGTGTIDINGNVGEIGGVKYKLIGAVNNKAKVFLCPKINYDEAINIAK